MHRPMMQPGFMDEVEALESLPKGARWRWVIHLGRGIGRVLMWRPFVSAEKREALALEGWSWRGFASGLIRRMAIMPVMVVILVGGLVYNGTHPTAVEAGMNPGRAEVYYDQVTLLSADGTRLGGWLFPAVDERVVLEQKEKLLRRTYPAVVLVHHQGEGPDRMLPLVGPLHEAGMVVLIVGLRGTGTSDRGAQTFGLRESMDVKAAVEMLRRRTFVDPQRIGLVGTGTGATAALLAAREDFAIRALVLSEPIKDADEILTVIGPRHPWLSGLRPMCRWVFESVYEVDADQIRVRDDIDVLRGRALLMDKPGAQRFDTGAGVGQVRDYLVSRL